MKKPASSAEGLEMRIVAVDDNPDDIELIRAELDRSRTAYELTPARNREEFVQALAQRPNLVLSDYTMPGFGAMDVIELTRGYDETVPVVIISGSIGEDVAVDAMKRGASDYLLKDRLGRLPKALQNALERRRLDLARREAESSRLSLAAVIEATPDFVIITDTAGQPIYLNAAADRVCGRTDPTASLTDLIFTELFPGITPQSLHSAFAAAARVGFWRCETTLRDFAHWEIPVVLTIVAHFNARHEPERFSLLARDITVQKAALTELQQNQSLLRMASRLGRIGAWTVELPQMQITWSEEVRNIHEVPPDYVPTLENAINFYDPTYRDEIRAAVAACMRDGTPWNLELQIITARGRRVWVRAIGEAERDSRGAIRRLQGAFQDISDRKDAAEQTLQLAERLTTTLESITDAFFTVDSDWRFTYINHEAERLLRRTRRELLGKIIWEEFPESRDSTFEREYRRAVTGDRAVTFEEFYPPLELWFEVRAFPSSQGLAVYFRDVSERRKLEAERSAAALALRQSEEHYRLLFTRNPHPMWVFALEDRRFLAVNPAAVAKYGYTEEEFLGLTLEALLPTEESPHSQSPFPPESGSTCRHRTKSGQVIDVEMAADTIQFRGRPARLTLINDITERLSRETQIARQAALIDQTNDAIIVRDLNHQIQFWSKGAERMYGWTAAEAVGRQINILVGSDLAQFSEATQHLLSHGSWSGELEHVTKDQRKITVSARWSLLRDERGVPVAVLAIKSDITERKLIEAQFYRSQRLESIGTLAGGIAHDLNNLLAPIVMGVGLLRLSPLGPKERSTVDIISRSADRGSHLVRQVLAFARGVEGVRMTLNVRRLVGELELIIANTFPKNISYFADIAEDVSPIRGDPTQFHQVLLNLCVNARDAMPNGGQLGISVRNQRFDEQYAATRQGVKAGNYVLIAVSDTGIGISKENIDRIFEPFFTTKEPSKGTGLGLSTALGIVRRLGGFLNVTSEPGKGSTFTVYFPAQTESSEESMPSPQTPELPRGHGEWVMVVDDEASIRSITHQTLEAFGYQVIVADDGADAIGKFAANRGRVGLIITDIMMPIMDGHALIAAVRRIAPTVPILATSGLQAKLEAANSADARFDRLILKPFSAETLLQEVHLALSAKPPGRP